jgi:hypothetical protein
LILEIVWSEEKWQGVISPFILMVILYRFQENMTGSDWDDAEIGSRLLVSFCCENSVVPYPYPADDGKRRQKFRLLVEQQSLFGAISTK